MDDRSNDPRFNQDADREEGTPAVAATNGLGYNGEFRVGKITLGLEGDGRLSIRKEGVAEKTLVSEMELEGIFTDHFFTREYGDTTADAENRTKDLAAQPHSTERDSD